MRKAILLLITPLFFCVGTYAQSEVILNINHKLGFEFYNAVESGINNMEQEFEVERLEYYISDIKLVDAIGTETLVEELWMLVNGNRAHSQSLGELEISDITKIKFSIGVGPDVNHNDPTAWPASHPLAPQAPSMHWGWNAGYRFVAMEGKAGNNMNVVWQLHGLGDDNFFETEIEVTPRVEDGVINIDLDADYARALENINVEQGPISHGETGPARICLINFRDYVFSQQGSISSTETVSALEFEVFPNPSEGLVTLNLPSTNGNNALAKIYDTQGKLIQSKNINTSSYQIEFEHSGLYYISIFSNGATGTQKVLID